MELDNQMLMTLFYILLGLSILNTVLIILMVAIVSSSRVGKFLTMFVLGGPIGYPSEGGGPHAQQREMGFKTGGKPDNGD